MTSAGSCPLVARLVRPILAWLLPASLSPCRLVRLLRPARAAAVLRAARAPTSASRRRRPLPAGTREVLPAPALPLLPTHALPSGMCAASRRFRRPATTGTVPAELRQELPVVLPGPHMAANSPAAPEPRPAAVAASLACSPVRSLAPLTATTRRSGRPTGRSAGSCRTAGRCAWARPLACASPLTSPTCRPLLLPPTACVLPRRWTGLAGSSSRRRPSPPRS